MKRIEVVAGIICDGTPHSAEARFFATQRGYGDYKDGWEFPGGKAPELLEHEAARWLAPAELHSVNWLPADIEVVKALVKG